MKIIGLDDNCYLYIEDIKGRTFLLIENKDDFILQDYSDKFNQVRLKKYHGGVRK